MTLAPLILPYRTVRTPPTRKGRPHVQSDPNPTNRY